MHYAIQRYMYILSMHVTEILRHTKYITHVDLLLFQTRCQVHPLYFLLSFFGRQSNITDKMYCTVLPQFSADGLAKVGIIVMPLVLYQALAQFGISTESCGARNILRDVN